METFKTSIESPEGAERFGREVDVDVHFIRHAIRDKTSSEGVLLPAGRDAAREYGRELEGRDVLKAYASPELRAIQTVEEIAAAAPHDRKYGTPRIRAELNMSGEQFSPEFLQLWGAKMRELGEEAAIDWYLKFGSERPDPRTDSPREIAAGMANLLQRYIDMGNRLYNGSQVDLVNGTHGGLPESLLKEILVWQKNDERKIGFESLTDIGGQFKYAEGVVFKTHRDREGNLTVRAILRGQEYEVDLDKLRQLAKEYKRRHEESDGAES